MSFLLTFVDLLFNALSLAILAEVLLSWIRPDPYHPAVQFIRSITSPILDPLRRVIPPIGGMFDISPIVAILLLQFVHRVVLQLLSTAA